MFTNLLIETLPTYFSLLTGREESNLIIFDENNELLVQIEPPLTGWTVTALKNQIVYLINNIIKHSFLIYLDTQFIGLHKSD